MKRSGLQGSRSGDRGVSGSAGLEVDKRTGTRWPSMGEVVVGGCLRVTGNMDTGDVWTGEYWVRGTGSKTFNGFACGGEHIGCMCHGTIKVYISKDLR